MSPDEYWNQSPYIARAYREAEKMRRHRRNEELWWQGMYIYEALCDVSPVLNAFAKSGTEPAPYAKKPYPITQEEIEERKKEKEIEQMNEAKRYMEAAMKSFNKRK